MLFIYRKVILDTAKANEYGSLAFDSKRVLNQITEGITGMNGEIKAMRW